MKIVQKWFKFVYMVWISFQRAKICWAICGLIFLKFLKSSDATAEAEAEAEALTWDLFGWKWKGKQLNQTASTSSFYIDYTVL